MRGHSGTTTGLVAEDAPDIIGPRRRQRRSQGRLQAAPSGGRRDELSDHARLVRPDARGTPRAEVAGTFPLRRRLRSGRRPLHVRVSQRLHRSSGQPRAAGRIELQTRLVYREHVIDPASRISSSVRRRSSTVALTQVTWAIASRPNSRWIRLTISIVLAGRTARAVGNGDGTRLERRKLRQSPEQVGLSLGRLRREELEGEDRLGGGGVRLVDPGSRRVAYEAPGEHADCSLSQGPRAWDCCWWPRARPGRDDRGRAGSQRLCRRCRRRAPAPRPLVRSLRSTAGRAPERRRARADLTRHFRGGAHGSRSASDTTSTYLRFTGAAERPASRRPQVEGRVARPALLHLYLANREGVRYEDPELLPSVSSETAGWSWARDVSSKTTVSHIVRTRLIHGCPSG